MSAAPLLRRKLRRDLRQRRAQVIAVSLTVFVGIAVFVLSADMATNLHDSYDVTYERTSFADVWVTGGGDGVVAELADIEGVTRIETRTSVDAGVTFGDRSVTTRVIGYSSDTTLNQLLITDGVGIEDGRDGVVVEQHSADHFGLGPGDTVVVAGHGEVDVVGVAVSPEWLWVAPNQQELVVDPDEFAVLFVPEALARTIAPDRPLQLLVGVEEHDADAIDAAVDLATVRGASEVLTQATHPSNQALQADLEGFSQLAVMFPVLFLAAAGLATSVLLGRLIAQQTAEIGMLRANGYDTRTIQRHFVRYGVVVSLLGALPGLPLGVLGGWATTGAYTDFLGIPFSSRAFHPLTLVYGVVFAVIVGGLAGGLPARAAARIEPAAAMRPGGQIVNGRLSLLERIYPGRLPNWLRVAVRNLGRQPRRAATTVVGVVLALVLTITAFVLNDTVNNLFVTQFQEIDQRGLVVALDDPNDTETIAAIGSVEGVEVVEPHLEDAALFVADGVVVADRFQIFAANTGLHDFTPVGGLPEDGVVLSASAVDQLGVEIGDTIEMRALDGTSGTVRVVGSVSEPMSGTSYLSAKQWDALGGDTPSMLAIGLEDRDDHRVVRDQISAVAGVDSVTDRVAIQERVEHLLAGSRFFVGVILLLAVIMAVALIFNALTVTIGERESEVATLQANGVGRSWIRRTITAENLTTVTLGVVPGLVLGRLSAGFFVEQFSTDQFRFDAVLKPSSIVGALLMIVVCAGIAQWPGLRRLDRLDLPAKVRERAL